MEHPDDKYLSGRPLFIPHTNAACRRLGPSHGSRYVQGVGCAELRGCHRRGRRQPATLAGYHLTPSRLETHSRNPPRISV